MLTYDLSRADCPVYLYLYKCIKEDILSGNLKADEKLPSKRSLAENNGVSTITVQNAYDQLISEGYIYTLSRRGYYVSGISSKPPHIKIENVNLNIDIPENKIKYDMDLSGNYISPESFPFSVWAKLTREIISERSVKLMERSPSGGIYELREAIAGHLKSFRGMDIDPNQIIVGAGTEYLYGLIIQLLGYDKVYCVENPGYVKIQHIYESNNVVCRHADMDDKGITVGELIKSGADIAHISPTHHFPTGITMPISRRYELLAWANEKDGRYIIEDDYDSEFRINGRPIPPLLSIDASEKVIYMNTFSKSLAPTIRISYMVLPGKLANEFYKRLSFYSCTVSSFEQLTLAEFIRRGYFEKHINRMRLYYARKRGEIFERIAKSPLGQRCSIVENDSGLHFILYFKTNKSDTEIKQALNKNGINMTPLSEYYYNKSTDSHGFIFNYSNIDIGKVSDMLNKMCFLI